MDCDPIDRLRDLDARGICLLDLFQLSPLLMGLGMKSYAHFEHIFAFALLGALFTVAYPRPLILVLCVVGGGAVILELAKP